MKGFKCDILIITKSSKILKILAKLKKLSPFELLIETQKNKVRTNSNDVSA